MEGVRVLCTPDAPALTLQEGSSLDLQGCRVEAAGSGREGSSSRRSSGGGRKSSAGHFVRPAIGHRQVFAVNPGATLSAHNSLFKGLPTALKATQSRASFEECAFDCCGCMDAGSMGVQVREEP